MKNSLIKLSIGITTYNREDFLRNCLQSILNQDCEEIEVLVGNDYISKKINADELGFNDSRLKIFNHEKNLGEVENLNTLRKLACGEYFIWMADDDEFHPRFIDIIWPFLNENRSFVVPQTFAGNQIPMNIVYTGNEYSEVDSENFLARYLQKEIAIQGVYIVYKRELLNQFNGIQSMGRGVANSFYADTYLIFKLCLNFSKIPFINFPLCLYRVHDESISNSSKDVNALLQAQGNFISFLSNENLIKGKSKLLILLFRFILIPDFNSLLMRSNSFLPKYYLIFATNFVKLRRVLSFCNVIQVFFIFLLSQKIVIKNKIYKIFKLIGKKK